MGKIVTFGEIMLRLSPNGYYRFFQNDQMQATFGGAEANVAVSLAQFGENVVYVTKVPNQAIGHSAIDSLKSFGVDTSHVFFGGDRLGIYYLEKGVAQRSSICIYDRKGSSFSGATYEDFDWNKIFEDTDWFHFTGITPALGENIAGICQRACVEAKRRKIMISCDLNYRSKLWGQDEANRIMSQLCKYVDVCIANEEDAKNVFGISAPNTNIYEGQIDKVGYKSVAEQLMDLFNFKYIAFTFRSSFSATRNGWTGMIYDGNGYYYAREYSIDHIVDRVGGGDSFGAGLIYSLHNGMNKQEALEFAVAASTLKHSIEGDYNRTSVDEVLKLVNGDSSGRVQR